MKPTLAIIGALIAAFLLTGCDEAAQEAYKTRHQQQNVTPLSEAVVLTPKGRAMDRIGAYPTRVKLPQGSSYSGTRNVTCALESVAFQATGRLDSRILLPSYGKQTPPMTVTCDFDGKPGKTKVVKVNRTSIGYQTEAAGQILFGAGLLGAAIAAGQASERDKSRDIWGYPPQIEVKP